MRCLSDLQPNALNQLYGDMGQYRSMNNVMAGVQVIGATVVC